MIYREPWSYLPYVLKKFLFDDHFFRKYPQTIHISKSTMSFKKIGPSPNKVRIFRHVGAVGNFKNIELFENDVDFGSYMNDSNSSTDYALNWQNHFRGLGSTTQQYYRYLETSSNLDHALSNVFTTGVIDIKSHHTYASKPFTFNLTLPFELWEQIVDNRDYINELKEALKDLKNQLSSVNTNQQPPPQPIKFYVLPEKYLGHEDFNISSDIVEIIKEADGLLKPILYFQLSVKEQSCVGNDPQIELEIKYQANENKLAKLSRYMSVRVPAEKFIDYLDTKAQGFTNKIRSKNPTPVDQVDRATFSVETKSNNPIKMKITKRKADTTTPDGISKMKK